MLPTSADGKVSTHPNKGCRDWREVSEEPIRHLYVEMGKWLWEMEESAASPFFPNLPMLSPLAAQLLDEDSARFLKMVSFFFKLHIYFYFH